MASRKSNLAFTTALAGLVFLQPQTFAPQHDAQVLLPPDSLVRAVATQNDLLFHISVSAGVDINAAAADGRTPLLVALDQDQKETVPRLLELGASVDAADQDGRTPLMVAAAAGEMDLLQTFLARSSRPDAWDNNGRTAAHYAAEAHQRSALEALLAVTPDVLGAGEDERDLLAIACDSGDAKMIEMVLERYPGGLEWTPLTQGTLQAALQAENAGLVRLLLARHAGPPTVRGSNVPLLAQAVVTEKIALLQMLLSAGADPNVILPPDLPKEFVESIASGSLRDYVRADQGVTPLMLAAGLGRLDSARILLAAGAAKNLETARYKMMALYFAASTNKPQCVQLLLGRGPSRDELRVEISLASQRASIIRNGVSVLQTAISTGRKGFDTPAGEYVITDKNRNHRSTIYHAEMPFFMRLSCRDFGLHAGVVPNYPASHGCIRLPAAMAEKLFSEIPVGTLVTIN